MCGIVGIFNIKSQSQELRNKALRMAQKIRHRGPDWSGIYVGGSAILAHERLSIVDPESGGQPLYSPDGKQILAVNGEIYNHREIRSRYAGKYAFRTGSDCEVILALYKDKGPPVHAPQGWHRVPHHLLRTHFPEIPVVPVSGSPWPEVPYRRLSLPSFR